MHDQKQGGLVLRVPVSARGRTKWELLDQYGRLDREATARAAGGHWNPNLITDLGLVTLWANPTGVETAREYLVVGDGSGAPDPTDTALDSFVAATAGNGGINDSGTSTKPADDIVITRQRVRELTASGNLNLSEYGFSHLNNGSSLAIRELFRDGEGNPTTVNVLNGKKLRLVHELECSMPYETPVEFDIERYDAGGTLVDTDEHSGTLYVVRGSANDATFGNEVTYCLFGSADKPGGGGRGFTYVWPTTPSAPAWNAAPTQPGTSPSNTVGRRSYGSGPTRTRFSALSETQFSGNIAAIGLFYLPGGSGGVLSSAYGLMLVLDSPQVIAKSNIQTMSLDIAYTYARG